MVWGNRHISRRGGYAAWLEERDAAVPLPVPTCTAKTTTGPPASFAAGGGMQAVIEATGLRTHENALRLLDAAILAHALDNDAAPASAADPAEIRGCSGEAARRGRPQFTVPGEPRRKHRFSPAPQGLSPPRRLAYRHPVASIPPPASAALRDLALRAEGVGRRNGARPRGRAPRGRRWLS